MTARSLDYLLQAVIMIMIAATPDEEAGRRRSDSMPLPCMQAMIYPSMATPGGAAAAAALLMVLGFLLPPAAMVAGTCFGSCSCSCS